jgi:hypothetical protein
MVSLHTWLRVLVIQPMGSSINQQSTKIGVIHKHENLANLAKPYKDAPEQ